MCVMIGPNGVGKTSMLDVLSLLASSAAGRLSSALSEHGGLNNVLSYQGPESLDLFIQGQVEGRPLGYELALRPAGIAYQLKRERLWLRRANEADEFEHIKALDGDVQYRDRPQGELLRPNWEFNPLETALSQVPKMFREPETFRAHLSSSTYYHLIDVGPRSPIRLPQPLQPAYLPGKNGEELISCLYSLRESERHRFEAIEDALRAAFPRFERLDFPLVAAGTLALLWRGGGVSKPFYMSQLSEGTLRFLWLATLLQSPGLTSLTLLDEPEVSLHPELLSLLAGLMREASRRTQLVVATHSDRLVRFLEPKEVLAMNSCEDESTEVTWADQLDINDWLAEYTLDELWTNGRLGARA